VASKEAELQRLSALVGNDEQALRLLRQENKQLHAKLHESTRLLRLAELRIDDQAAQLQSQSKVLFWSCACRFV
jgi:hypothetical protein